MRREAPRRPLAVFTLGVLGALAAAGCGSGSEGEDPGFSVSPGDAGVEAAKDAARDAKPADAAHDAPLDAEAGPTALGPPYPIVLAHGFFGWEQFAGTDFLTYFWGVKDRLASRGETEVFTPGVDPFNDSDTRGHQLEAAVADVLAKTGRGKVVLIGHSQGCLDSRVVAHLHPDWVAAMVSIAGPHGGSPVADAFVGPASNPVLGPILDGFVQLVGPPIWSTVDAQTSLKKSMQQLSSDGMTAFNAKYPPTASVPTWSIAGRSLLSNGGSVCKPQLSVPFVSKWDRERDPINAMFLASGVLIQGSPFSPEVNDGLVRAVDAKWGTFLGCLPTDHVDEIGQIFGQSPGLGNGFDHLEFYGELVSWLRAQGY